jgi:hypothetical protein
MKKYFRLALFAGSAVWLTLHAVGAFAYLTDLLVHTPPNYLTFQPPAKGGSYNDPAYGTSIKRVSDSLNTPNSAGAGTLEFITPEYSTMSPFNMDNSRFILQHLSYFGLYDGNGNYLSDLPFDVYASTEPRWSRSSPNILYFVNGNQFKKLDITTNIVTLVHTFSEYTAISGHGESDICFDGNHFVFAGDDRYVFVYEISTDTKGSVLDNGGRAFDSLYMAADDTVTVTWIQPGTARFNGVERFSRNMVFMNQVAHAGGHMDMSRDVDGSAILLWINSADPTPIANCQNGIVKVRLSDARQTCLVQFDWGVAVHVSAPDGSGYFFMETLNDSDPMPASGWTLYTHEVLQIKLDGSEVRRLFHHRSRPFDSYYWQPRTSVSHDGTKLVFASNYGLQGLLSGIPADYTDSYLVTVPGASPSPSPTPTPTPTPSPTPAPTPSPTPSPSPSPTPPPGAIRFEQDSAAVVYTGTWSANTMSAHSGGSAVLAMDAGARASFAFTGTSVSWIAYRDEWSGKANVYVDGILKSTIDTYATPAQAQAVTYSIGGLTAAAHTLIVESTGTKSAASGGAWVWVDAFDVSSALPPPPPPTGWTRYEQSDPAIAYAGTWPTSTSGGASGGSQSDNMTRGNTATFTLNGTGFRWIGYKDQNSGMASVYVDGVKLKSVDCYSLTPLSQAVLFSKTGMASGKHTVQVYVNGSKRAASLGKWVWLDAIDVQ